MFRRCKCEDWPCCGHGFEEEGPIDDIGMAELRGELVTFYDEDEVQDQEGDE